MVYTANWVITYYLPPFTRTWKIRWSQRHSPNPVTPTLYKATILEGWHSFTGSSGIGTAKTFPKIWFDCARAFKGLSDLRRMARKIYVGGTLCRCMMCVCICKCICVCIYLYVNWMIWVQKIFGCVCDIASIWCINYTYCSMIACSVVIVQWVQQQLDSKMNHPAGFANMDIWLPIIGSINKGILLFFIAIFVGILLLLTIVSVLNPTKHPR